MSQKYKARSMKVTLLQNTSLKNCAFAMRTCWQSFEKGDDGGEKDKELIDRIGNKLKHASTLEHLVYTFYIQGISRALLQELARHRIASLSVKSTRYTLKELKNEAKFELNDTKRAEKYLVLTDSDLVNQMSLTALENLRIVLNSSVSIDKAKYCLPESYKTELTWTINARALQNFISLRSSKSALWEIQNLAKAVFEAIPDEHRYIFEECLNKQI